MIDKKTCPICKGEVKSYDTWYKRNNITIQNHQWVECDMCGKYW